MMMKYPLFLLSSLVLFTANVNGQTTCASSDDCSNTEFCAVSGTCVTYGCDELYDIIKDQITGLGSLECTDYEGTQAGQIYACSVGSQINGASIGLSIRPPLAGQEDTSGIGGATAGSSVARPFERECRAEIPKDEADPTDLGSIFYCLDNEGADYTQHIADIDASGLVCENGDLPVHASVRINLLTGISVGSEKVEGTFDSNLADSAYYASILGKESEDSGSDFGGQGSGSNSDSSAYSFTTTTMAVIIVVVSGICTSTMINML